MRPRSYLSLLALLRFPVAESEFSVRIAAYIFSGFDGSNVFYDGMAVGDQLGASVSSAGDVDGDGFVDVMVGALRTISGALMLAPTVNDPLATTGSVT